MCHHARVPQDQDEIEPGSPGDLSVGVVGLGYVGLPLVVAFAEAGASVVAVDTDIRKIDALPARHHVHRGRLADSAGRRS